MQISASACFDIDVLALLRSLGLKALNDQRRPNYQVLIHGACELLLRIGHSFEDIGS